MRLAALWRSDPALAAGLSPALHGVSIALSLGVTILVGVLMAATGHFLPESASGAALILVGLGYILSFAPVVSWLGHVPLAVLLGMLVRRGWAGWAVVALAGLAIGAFWAALLDLALARYTGPLLALVQFAILRHLVRTGSHAKPS